MTLSVPRSRAAMSARLTPVFLIVLALLGVFAAAISSARADGTIYRAVGCGDYIFVTTPSGYSMLRGSTDGLKDGDTLQGNVEQIGGPTLFDETAGRSVFAQVSELRLTLPEVQQRVATYCRSALAETPVSGYVTRASECGSKIFLNTPQGYTVLDRLAGGVVADGDTVTGNFNRPGRVTAHDTQSNSDLTVFVEDLWLSASAVQRKITQSCRQQNQYSR